MCSVLTLFDCASSCEIDSMCSLLNLRVQCDEQHVWATCAVSGVSLIMWSVLNLSTPGIHSASSCPVVSTSGTRTGGMHLVR